MTIAPPALIMAGGRGLRLRPLTDSTPKPLLPLGDETIIDHIITWLKSNGVKRFYVSLGYKSWAFGSHFQKRWPDEHVTFLHEREPRGTAGILSDADLQCREEGGLLVVNGDVLTSFKVSQMWESCASSIAVRRHSYSVDYGVVEQDVFGNLFHIEEKPVLSCMTSAGIYYLHTKKSRITGKTVIDMPEHLNSVCKREVVNVHLIDAKERWVDIGTPAQYELAQMLYSSNNNNNEGRTAR